MADYYSSEDHPLRGESLDEKMDVEVRHGFIRKVFSLVTAQLLLTSMIAAPFVFYQPAAKQFLFQNQALFVIVSMMPMAVLCCAMCNPSLLREYPKNYLMLLLFTLGFGLVTGAVCAQYEVASVLLAVGMTACITLGLTAFACQTKYDFTGFGPYLYSFCLVMFFTSLLMMFLPYSRPMEIVYSSLAVCLFSFYMVYDVQMIVGAKHGSHKFGLDDYVFAAMTLYMDIIQLFLHLLRLFGDRR